MTGMFWERRRKKGFAALLSLLSRLASIVTFPASLHSALSCSRAATCAALRADEGEVGADCCLQPMASVERSQLTVCAKKFPAKSRQ